MLGSTTLVGAHQRHGILHQQENNRRYNQRLSGHRMCSGSGRVIGPLPLHSVPQLHISSFGVIPKKTPGKWRLIVDLSAPEGSSVNDGVDEKYCSLHYISVDNAAEAIVANGRGALL